MMQIILKWTHQGAQIIRNSNTVRLSFCISSETFWLVIYFTLSPRAVILLSPSSISMQRSKWKKRMSLLKESMREGKNLKPYSLLPLYGENFLQQKVTLISFLYFLLWWGGGGNQIFDRCGIIPRLRWKKSLKICTNIFCPRSDVDILVWTFLALQSKIWLISYPAITLFNIHPFVWTKGI